MMKQTMRQRRSTWESRQRYIADHVWARFSTRMSVKAGGWLFNVDDPREFERTITQYDDAEIIVRYDDGCGSIVSVNDGNIETEKPFIMGW